MSGRIRTDDRGFTARCLRPLGHTHHKERWSSGRESNPIPMLTRQPHRRQCFRSWRARWDSNPRSGFPQQIKSLLPLPLGPLAHRTPVLRSIRHATLLIGSRGWDSNPRVRLMRPALQPSQLLLGLAKLTGIEPVPPVLQTGARTTYARAPGLETAAGIEPAYPDLRSGATPWLAVIGCWSSRGKEKARQLPGSSRPHSCPRALLVARPLRATSLPAETTRLRLFLIGPAQHAVVTPFETAFLYIQRSPAKKRSTNLGVRHKMAAPGTSAILRHVIGQNTLVREVA